MPSERNRVLGLQMYKYKVKGFLHWGTIFIILSFQRNLSIRLRLQMQAENFRQDSFVVYPGEDRQPLDSTRLHVFYDAFQDMTALQLLESKIGYDKTLAIVEQGLDKPLTFSDYPHDPRWLESVRERVNKAIAENI